MSDWKKVAELVIGEVEKRLDADEITPEVRGKLEALGADAADLARRANENPDQAERLALELAVVEAHVKVVGMLALGPSRAWTGVVREIVSMVRVAITIAAALG